MPEPIEVVVKRYRCPFCHHSRSTRGWALKHMARCWKNPDARGCKTCEYFSNFGGDSCALRVSLAGEMPCKECEGSGWRNNTSGYAHDCPHCGGRGAIPAGPIIGCPKWAPLSPNDNEKD